LASLYLYAAEYDRAEPIMVRVLGQMEKQYGPASPMLLNSLSSLAVLYTSMGSYDRAQPLYQRALAIARADDPKSLNVANLTGALGSLDVFRARWDDAIPKLEECLALWEKQLGPDHADLAKPISALAS